jgi:hypothetical protein
MNKEQLELLGEAYEGYVESYNKGNASGIQLDNGTKRVANIDEFIRRIRQDIPFAEKWGLKIEERELSLEERSIIAGSNHNEVSQNIKMFTGIDEDHTLHKNLDDNNIPTKLITITYKETIIESHEQTSKRIKNW